MTGDTELNVDNLIARLLEGTLKKKSIKMNIIFNKQLIVSSTWMSTRKNCSND